MMVSVRLFICSIVAAVCMVTSLSIGSGKAAAAIPGEGWFQGIAAGLDRVGLFAEEGGLVANKPKVINSLQTLWSRQRAGLPKISEEAQNAGWMRTAKSPAVRVVVKKAAKWACNTAVELANDPDPTDWGHIMDAAEKNLASAAAGESVTLINDLSGIADRYEQGCICAAAAQLEVFVEQHMFCSVI
jgi:hypothetical protein